MEALGQITGGIAHELNNMLLAINLNLEALTEEVPVTEATQPLFDGAQAAIEQATNVILQLLAYSRRQPLDAADFDVNRAIVETRMLLRLVLPANIAIETDLSPYAACGLRRSQPVRNGAAQSRAQRQRCDAARRHADDRDRADRRR